MLKTLVSRINKVGKSRTFHETVPAHEVDDRLRTQLFSLFNRYYADISAEKFAEDLYEKDHVIILKESRWGSVVGFTTVKTYEINNEGTLCRVAFSGDTIVDEEFWGDSALSKPLFLYLCKQYLSSPTIPFYWFLISKGYKTYIAVSRNLKEFWPRYDQPTPSHVQSLIMDLAKSRYGEAWDAEKQILHFKQPMGRLLEDVAPITEEMLKVPEIAHFQKLNPDHLKGDELCCVAKLDHNAVTYYLQRTLGKTLKKVKRA